MLTVLLPEPKKRGFRVALPLILGDGKHLINPTAEELDASLWD